MPAPRSGRQRELETCRVLIEHTNRQLAAVRLALRAAPSPELAGKLTARAARLASALRQFRSRAVDLNVDLTVRPPRSVAAARAVRPIRSAAPPIAEIAPEFFS